MTFEQLEYVLAVERAGTIAAAAEDLNVSHSTISKSISRLEEELGFSIFLRNRSGSSLTPKGMGVVELAQSIFKDLDAIKNLGQKNTPKNQLRIGTYPIDSTRFLRDAVIRFSQVKPHTAISIKVKSFEDILSDLQNDILDFGLCLLTPSQIKKLDPIYSATIIFSSRLTILCNSESPLAKKEYVTVQDIASQSFALQADEYILNAFKNLFPANTQPNIIMQTDNTELIMLNIQHGNMITIHNDNYIAKLLSNLSKIPLKTAQGYFVLNYTYIRSAKSTRSLMEREFIKELKSCNSVR